MQIREFKFKFKINVNPVNFLA